MAPVPPLVYLVRHGQSQWNVQRLTQGQIGHPELTGLGRSQACAAARLIALDLEPLGRNVDRIISSDLVRAVQTADIMANVLGGALSVDARLREQHLGSLQGRGYEETWAAAAAHDWSDPALPIAGGESLMDVHDRMAATLEHLDCGQVTVLVSHGDAIRAAIAHLRGIPVHEAPWVEVSNGAVARVGEVITWLGQ